MALSTLIAKRTNPKSVLRRVAIVGGTHGNERAGVHLVQHFEAQPEVVRRPSFETHCFLSNVDAIQADRRYVATDLNRCFDHEFLERAANTPADKRIPEQKRALEVDKALGPKFSTEPFADMVFDLHNTTANCGVLLCFHKDDDFAREVAAYLKYFVDSEICTVYWPQDDPPFLPTIGRSGMTVEVGPVAHSTVSAAIYERTKKLLQHALDYIELHNEYIKNPSSTKIKRVTVKLPVAERVAQLDYPRDQQGRLTGFIHPSLQGSPELHPKFPLRQGSPIFSDLAGDTVKLDLTKLDPIGAPLDPNGAYLPMFINEAAYYEKGTAFFLTRVVERDVSILAPETRPKL